MTRIQKEQENISVKKPDIVWKPPFINIVSMDDLKKLIEAMPDGVMLEVTFADG